MSFRFPPEANFQRVGFIAFVSDGLTHRVASRRIMGCSSSRSKEPQPEIAQPTRSSTALHTRKVVLVGDTAVGKSSVVLRYTKNQFHEAHQLTIGAVRSRFSSRPAQPVCSPRFWFRLLTLAHVLLGQRGRAHRRFARRFLSYQSQCVRRFPLRACRSTAGVRDQGPHRHKQEAGEAERSAPAHLGHSGRGSVR